MTSGDAIEHLPVQEHDLLVCRVPGGRVSIQPETLERVVKQGLADADAGLASPHAVVERDDLLLRVGQARVRTDFQRDVRVPAEPSNAIACGAIQRQRGAGLEWDWYSTSSACLVRIASMTRRSVWASMPRTGLGTVSKAGIWPIQVSSCVTMPSEIDRNWDR